MGLFVFVAVAAVVSIWYRNLSMVLDRPAVVLGLTAAGAGATLTVVLWFARIVERREPGTTPARWTSRGWLLAVIAGGIVGRLVLTVTVEVPLLSDGAAYFRLAEKLYTEGVYEDLRGDRAYWPPGYPLFLLAGFAIAGIKPWIPTAGNMILFVVTSVATYRLGRLALGEQAGRLAAFLLAVWPNYIFLASIASKEMLLTALLPVALLFYLQAIDPTVRGSAAVLRLLSSGMVLGFASLTQPSMMLFPSALAGHAVMRRDRLMRSARQIALVIVGLAAAIAPWAVRNLHILNAFVPVSTNGGDVFYRANNPKAMGGYAPAGELSLADLNEVDRSHTGYRWGLEWIRANPHRFLGLAVMKQVLFLGDDSNGVAETLRRGRPVTALYLVAKGLSNAYWLGVWALILLALRLRPRLYQRPALILLDLSVIYLLAIDSVFESGSRHHVPILGLLAILAAGPFGRRSGHGT
jgi:4-amino-4-deoxy-L-arabinose transferase-like glycosyltransferase